MSTNAAARINTPPGSPGHGEDFAAWAAAQARLLAARRFDELDVANLVEEIESVGRSERAELRNRLTLLIAHLLKYGHGRLRTPAAGWRRTIREQRRMIRLALLDSPSLVPHLAALYAEAWPGGIHEALMAFGDHEPDSADAYAAALPEAPAFDVDAALDDDFLPAPND